MSVVQDPATITSPAAVRAPPPAGLRQGLLGWAGWVGLALVLAWAWQGADVRPLALLRDGANMAKFAAAFFPPNFADWRTYVAEMTVTVQIAVWGTALSVATAIPFGILCSANVVPVWVYQPARRLADAMRAINEVVFAMLFVAAVGLGPFAGVLAIWVHTAGVLAKLFSEAVEAIDPRPVEGIRATGASRLQEVVFGVVPQVMPLWISYSLYRLETSVRSATVLGIVGAGGIGQLLWEFIRGFYYEETAAVMLVVIVTVSLIDLASQQVRRLAI